MAPGDHRAGVWKTQLNVKKKKRYGSKRSNVQWWNQSCEGELEECGQKIETSSHKISKNLGCNVQHNDYR